MVTRKLNDGDVAGYLDGDKLIRCQNGIVKLADNTHANIGQNGKIASIYKMEKESKKIEEDSINEQELKVTKVTRKRKTTKKDA